MCFRSNVFNVCKYLQKTNLSRDLETLLLQLNTYREGQIMNNRGEYGNIADRVGPHFFRI